MALGLYRETLSLNTAWTVLEPGGELFFQMVDRGLDEYFQVSPSDVGFDGDGLADASVSLTFVSWIQVTSFGCSLLPLGYLFRRSLGRGANLETWRGTDPEFPREFVGAGDPEPGSGTWDLGPGSWNPESRDE
ncbi:hypothetical protein YC2023_107876 [Brassica napus]